MSGKEVGQTYDLWGNNGKQWEPLVVNTGLCFRKSFWLKVCKITRVLYIIIHTCIYIYRYICICIPYISIQLIVLEPYNYTCTLQYYIVIHILVIHSRTRNTQMFSRIMDPEVSSPFPKLEPNMLEPQTCCLWSVSSGCLAWQALHFVTL